MSGLSGKNRFSVDGEGNAMKNDAIIGVDGVARCPWGTEPQIYRDYHDQEWGRSVTGDNALFERISLEAFQSGLSWLTILRKREAFRQAFASFDIDTVAAFDETDVDRLLSDQGIVRNRAKINATINNAQVISSLNSPLEEVLWSFQPAAHSPPQHINEVPATTEESTALAARLKKLGFRFTGPTTAYAMMQAIGIVDDHVAGCHLASG